MKFPIPETALAQHIAVLGKTGAGKTNTAKTLIEHVVEEGARVCILDPIKSDWWGLISSADGKRAGLPFHILGGPRGHVPVHAAAGKAIAELVAHGDLPLSIIDMADFAPGGQAKFFIDFAPTLLRRVRGVVYLVLEEAHLFAPKERSGIGDENMMIHWAKTLATAGRSKGIRLIVVTQRTQALHNAVLGSCDTIIAHRLTAPADQKPVKDWLKSNVDTETRQRVEGSLATLKTGHGWVCSGEANMFDLVQFPRAATYDNTATPTGDGEEIDVRTAAVDQEKLRAIVGRAVEEAQANDPTELKKRIRYLEQQLSEKGATHSAADIVEARRTGEREGFDKGATHGYQRGWEECVKAMSSVLKDAIDSVPPAPPMLGEPAIGARSESPERRVETHRPAEARQERRTGTALTVPRARQLGERAPSSLPAPQQKILDKLAWLEWTGISPAPKETLAAVCGVSPTSGGYFNNLGKLRSAGLIEYPQAGTVAFTSAGQALSNPVAADDGRKVHEHWLDVVSGPQQKILLELINEHPRQLQKDELAERIGVSPTSGGYFNNLGRLRTLGAIDYPSAGKVALTRYVMP